MVKWSLITVSSGQPLDLAPPVPEWLTSEQRLMLWMEVMDACEALLVAGLRREVGPHGDWIAAYRRWQAEHHQEHEQALFRLLERLGRSSQPHGR